MSSFLHDFITLFAKWEAINFNDIIKHPGKNTDYFFILIPIKIGIISEWVFYKHCKIYRT